MGNTNFFICQNFVNEFTNILHEKDNIDGFLIRLSDYTTAIINHDDSYHLFDSHARGTNGFPDQPWKAVAVYFPNSVSVCRHFQQFGDFFFGLVNRQVSSDEINLNLLAYVIVGDDSCPAPFLKPKAWSKFC